MKNKYMMFQPMHGIAVELQVIETAAKIAKILNRILVLPKVPILETLQYELGFEEYFDFPNNFEYISTNEFLKLYQHIDKEFHIIPKYKKEYLNENVGALHTTWLSLIHNSDYYSILELEIKKKIEVSLMNPISLKDVEKIFACNDEVIAFNYINGLLETKEYPFKFSKDFFKGYYTTPTPKKLIYIDNLDNYTSVHWRRGANVIEVSKELWGIKLPSYDKVKNKIETKKIYISTDTPKDLLKFQNDFIVIDKPQIDSPTLSAIYDINASIEADVFIGNIYSTFSNYIYHCRLEKGKPSVFV